MYSQDEAGATIMKVTIQNLGAIQHAEIDLKPLTILIGPNNAGKTWLAYTLAGIFGIQGWGKYTDAYTEEEFEKKYPPLDAALEKVTTGRITINMVELAEQYGEQYFQAIADYAKQWMPEFMSTQFATFEQMKVSIDLAGSKARLLERVKQFSIQREIAGGAFKISKRRGNAILQAYTTVEKAENGEVVTEPVPSEEMRGRLIDDAMRVVHQSLYSDVRVFPTERTTLATARIQKRKIPTRVASDEKMQEALDAIRNALKQVFSEPEIEIGEDPDVAAPKQGIGPVGYFINMFGSIMQIGSKEIEKRAKEARSNPKIRRYQELAQILEDQILFGSLDFSTTEPNPNRDLLFRPQPDVTLEMQIVSSMVKELAVLALYLRYLARPDELLVIDEPEMNLHPEAQAQMIEFLCLLVNAGLRVLVTTHSTYIVDHLTNLIYAAQLETEKQKSAAEIFFLEDGEAFISQDNVSVYCVDNGITENILREKGRMDWNTFSDVGDRIANIHSMM